MHENMSRIFMHLGFAVLWKHLIGEIFKRNGFVLYVWRGPGCPLWSDVILILIWYHYIVICTLVRRFNGWFYIKDMKLRVLLKEAFVVFHWLTFRITLLCLLASGNCALFWYKRQLEIHYICSFLFSTLLKFIDVMKKLQFDYSYKNIPIPWERY